jgi:hypothetical protein
MRSLFFLVILSLLVQGCGTQNWSARMPLDPIGASSLPETRASYSSRTVGFDGREEVHISAHPRDLQTYYYQTESGGITPVTVLVESTYEYHYTNNVRRYYSVPGYTIDPNGPKGGYIQGTIPLIPPEIPATQKMLHDKIKGK